MAHCENDFTSRCILKLSRVAAFKEVSYEKLFETFEL